MLILQVLDLSWESGSPSRGDADVEAMDGELEAEGR